jgi:hypothetical protein
MTSSCLRESIRPAGIMEFFAGVTDSTLRRLMGVRLLGSIMLVITIMLSPLRFTILPVVNLRFDDLFLNLKNNKNIVF